MSAEVTVAPLMFTPSEVSTNKLNALPSTPAVEEELIYSYINTYMY